MFTNNNYNDVPASSRHKKRSTSITSREQAQIVHQQKNTAAGEWKFVSLSVAKLFRSAVLILSDGNVAATQNDCTYILNYPAVNFPSSILPPHAGATTAHIYKWL